MVPINSNTSLISSPMSAEVGPAIGTKSKPIESADQQKLKKAAGDFESILLASLWKSMKESFKDPNEANADPASGTVDDWGIEAMSGAVGKAGGLGIGNMLIKHLAPDAGGPTTGKTTPEANVFGTLADRTL